SSAGRLAPCTEPQLAKVFCGQWPMSATHHRKKHFSQFMGIPFGRVILRAEVAQGIAHHLAGVGVAANFDFASDELLQIFRQRHLHACILPPRHGYVNARTEGRQRASSAIWRGPSCGQACGEEALFWRTQELHAFNYVVARVVNQRIASKAKKLTISVLITPSGEPVINLEVSRFRGQKVERHATLLP